MSKTPPYLKGLTDRQARIAGDVARQKKMLDELMASLERGKALIESYNEHIRDFDPAIDPDRIKPIAMTNRGKYGGYGALRFEIKKLLKDAAPLALSTPQIARSLHATFQLNLRPGDQYRHWAHNSVGNALKQLAALGTVLRIEREPTEDRRHSMWLWRGEISTLEDLRANADAAGIAIEETIEKLDDDDAANR